MPKYRKKPVVDEAIQFIGGDLDLLQEIEGWVGKARLNGGIGLMTEATLTAHWFDLWVAKSDSWCRVEQGSWVVAERDGNGYYPCTDEAFRDTHDMTEVLE